MTKQIIPTDSYSRLLQHIKQEIAEGLANAKQAYEQEKIFTYWKIGESISKHLSQHKTQSDYGKQLYKKLSRDLAIGEPLLYQISQFYTTYPDFKHSKNLTWTHYRLLTSVKDPEQRTIFESKVSSDNLSKRALENFLKEDKAKNKNIQPSTPQTKTPKKLTVSKGRLYTYSIFKGEYADTLLIDCGFHIYKESDVSTFRGSFAETVKTGTSYTCIESTAKKKDLYTYKAYVEKVVDADTLWVNIDCGFQIWTRQKIRLRGIDAPEMTTHKGVTSRTFVSNSLKGLPFVVVKSHGRDKYGRYLMDVFYSNNETDPQVVLEKGIFLNQVLLDEGLAEISR